MSEGGCKSWQSGGYIQLGGSSFVERLGCKSWQSGEYIQLAVAHFRVVEGCKSWQNGEYIQQSRALYYEKQAVSHGKMVGTAIKRYIPR